MLQDSGKHQSRCGGEGFRAGVRTVEVDLGCLFHDVTEHGFRVFALHNRDERDAFLQFPHGVLGLCLVCRTGFLDLGFRAGLRHGFLFTLRFRRTFPDLVAFLKQGDRIVGHALDVELVHLVDACGDLLQKLAAFHGIGMRHCVNQAVHVHVGGFGDQFRLLLDGLQRGDDGFLVFAGAFDSGNRKFALRVVHELRLFLQFRHSGGLLAEPGEFLVTLLDFRGCAVALLTKFLTGLLQVVLHDLPMLGSLRCGVREFLGRGILGVLRRIRFRLRGRIRFRISGFRGFRLR